MATDVIMPQMGESITEGTLVKWLKKVGDDVKRDEPLFEISTDKVDAEIPSPTFGVLVEILVNEGTTVPINTVVARIGVKGEQAATSAPAPEKAAEPTPVAADVSASVEDETPTATPETTAAAHSHPPSVEELRKQRSSPLVRNIAREHNVNIASVTGTGISGRVTKQDILGYIEKRDSSPAPSQPATVAPVTPTAPVTPVVATPPPAPIAPPPPVFKAGENVEIVPMTPMRKKIAEHMIASRRTSAHVGSVFEIDMTNIMKLREAHKDSFFARHGVKLTVTPFLVKATAEALVEWPIINTSIDGDNIVYKKDINIGVAVALDWGLIVPVIKNADEKNLLGLVRSVNDLSNRARSKQLKPEEVQGGTFTITNPGVFGSLFGTPIINQPQVAIMGVGTIEKRLTVMQDDSIAIRQKAYFSIFFDHRLIDGAVADQFMSSVKKRLETFTTSEL